MEKQLEDLLWLRSQTLTNNVHEKIYSLIRRVCQLSPELSDYETARWVSENHNDIFLAAQSRPRQGSWITTIRHLDEELANLGINESSMSQI